MVLKVLLIDQGHLTDGALKGIILFVGIQMSSNKMAGERVRGVEFFAILIIIGIIHPESLRLSHADVAPE